jgi:DNA-binding IscR family transcriptional regulator
VALREVVEAAEGAFTLERCILRGGPCHWEQACRDSLRRTSLADLVAADVRLEAGRGMLEQGLPPA